MTDISDKNCQDSCPNTGGEQNVNGECLSQQYTSVFLVPKMDCPSEERMIRLVLESVIPPVGLSINLPKRELTVFHDDNLPEIKSKLITLGFGASLQSTERSKVEEIEEAKNRQQLNQSKESITLKWLLAINAFMFLIELTVGWYAQSTGLIADSLDMFADAAVYGLALYAVGHSMKAKLKAAHISGLLQIILALGALSEVIRRYLFGSEPVSELMIVFGMIALIANSACLMLINKQKDTGAHMKASWIFSANDVIANLGVVSAGFLVMWTGSHYPDLLIGLIIAIIVLNGARRILQIRS